MNRKNQIPGIKIVNWSLYIFLYSGLAIFGLLWLMSITAHLYCTDFMIYYHALEKAMIGANPYEPYSVGSSFINHPLVLVLLRVIYFQNHLLQTQILWSSLNITAWIVSVISCNMFLGVLHNGDSNDSFIISQDAYLILLFMLFGPFIETIAIGQINIFATLFIILSLFLSERNKDSVAGLFLGLAIAIKTSPLILLLYFLYIRRFKVVCLTITQLIIFDIIPALKFNIKVIDQFVLILPRLSNEIHPTGYNESLISIFYQLLSDTILREFLPIFNIILLVFILFFLGWQVWRNLNSQSCTS